MSTIREAVTADISRVPFLCHLRGRPTAYIRHQRGAQVAHEGVGLVFWYRPRTAVISEVPVDDRELAVLFHARTSDFQDVAVQATVTYRIADPPLAAARLDFGIDPELGTWREKPLDQLAGMITETAQQYASDLLARTPLTTALAEGMPVIRQRVTDGLRSDARLGQTGVAVVGVRVVAVRPAPDVEKALCTPTREQIQTEADRATYGRRALAVEQERRIAENELQSKIELAARAERLVTQEGANEQRRMTEQAAAARITAEAEAQRAETAARAQAGRVRVEAAARAEALRLVGQAEADAEAARVAAVTGLDTSAVIALAVRDLADHLPAIGALTITPDMVTETLARLARAGVGNAGAGAGADR